MTENGVIILILSVVILNVLCIDYYLWREEEDYNRQKKEELIKPYIFVNQTIHNHDYAFETLRWMNECIEENGSVTVGDFYEMIGLDDFSKEDDNKYGWRDSLKNILIKTTVTGYWIDFPQPVRLLPKRKELK